MNSTTTRAFTRPRHPLDVPALTVLVFAGIGIAALAIARSLDKTLARREARVANRRLEQPCCGRQASPERHSFAELGAGESWRIR